MAPPMSASSFLERAQGRKALTVVEVGDWRTPQPQPQGPLGPGPRRDDPPHGHQGQRPHRGTLPRRATPGCPGRCATASSPRTAASTWSATAGPTTRVSGDDDVLRAVIAEKALPPDNEANTDGNRHFYGFECENLGDGEDPWPAVQLEAIEKAAAAICRHHGWTERSVIGHLEWQPGKVDPRGFTMAPCGSASGTA